MSLALLLLSSHSPNWGWLWEFTSTRVQTREPTHCCVTSDQSLNLSVPPSTMTEGSAQLIGTVVQDPLRAQCKVSPGQWMPLGIPGVSWVVFRSFPVGIPSLGTRPPSLSTCLTGSGSAPSPHCSPMPRSILCLQGPYLSPELARGMLLLELHP